MYNIPGLIIVTRNTDEVGNDSPGYWNHAAIISVREWVVEAQKEPNAVIAVPLEKFINRYPELVIFRVTEMDQMESVALFAANMIGLPYRRIASIFPMWRRPWLGENCVSVVRKAVEQATGKDPRWRRPDHIVASSLMDSYYRENYQEWIKPKAWFEGMVTDKERVFR